MKIVKLNKKKLQRHNEVNKLVQHDLKKNQKSHKHLEENLPNFRLHYGIMEEEPIYHRNK